MRRRTPALLALLLLGAAPASAPRPVRDPDAEVLDRIRELRGQGEFERARDEARAWLSAKIAEDGARDYEIRSRTVLVETLERIVGLPPAVRAEIAEVDRWTREIEELYRGGDYDGAARLARKQLAVRRRHLGEWHDEVASTLNILALMESLRGNYDEAEGLFELSLEMNRDILGEKAVALATGHNNFAVLFNARGDYLRAEEEFRQALHLYREYHSENEGQIAMGLHNLSVVLRKRGELARAETLEREALRIRRRIHAPDDRAIDYSLNNLASVLFRQGNHREAEELFRSVLEFRRRTLGEAHPDVGTALMNVAGVLESSGDRVEERIDVIREALEIRRQVYGESHRKIARSLHSLGTALAAAGRFDEAEARYGEALEMLEGIFGPEHPEIASVHGSLGSLARTRGDLGAAERAFRQALAMHRSFLGEAHREITRTLVRLANLEMLRKNPSGAVPLLEEAVSSYEASRRKVGTAVQRATFQDSPDLRLAAALLESGREAEAWLPAERYRGRILADLLASAAGDAPPGGEPAREQQVLPRERIQASLDGTTALVGWVDVAVPEGSTHSWGWVLRDRGPVLWCPLGPAAQSAPESAPAPGALRESLVLAGSWPFRIPDDSRLRRAAAAVARERITPLLPHLRGVTDLVVIPSGPLVGVPIELLVDESGTPLGDRFVISYTPSGTVFARLREDRTGCTPVVSALLLGDPPVPRGYVPLPGTRAEIARVASAVPEHRILLGPDASEANLVRMASTGELGRFDAIHLAAHAVPDGERPERSALILSAEGNPDPVRAAAEGSRVHDGRLTAEEIVREWKLDADLVTLSGCGTALGRRIAGEGFLGFAHAFFLAGARSLVLSLWKVDDEATALLMGRFYENLARVGDAASTSRAGALREARLWLRDRRAGDGTYPFRHPAYWSAFVLVGDPG